LRLRRAGLDDPAFDASFDEIFARRRAEADAFYDVITPPHLDQDGRSIFRQALAGMLWSKQYYHFVPVRNADGYHMDRKVSNRLTLARSRSVL
jgi:hypothetical protein